MNIKTIKQSIRALVLICCLFIAQISYAQPTFWTGNTNSPSNSFPFNVAGGKGVQSLILPGEFSAGVYFGFITKIYFQGTANVTGSWTNLVIKMQQHPTMTSLPANYITTGWTTVLSAPSISATSSAAGWMMFTLQTPFLYDPTKALLIDVSQCSSIGGSFIITNVGRTGMRRNYINAASCVFSYSGQDGNLVNTGINMQPAGYNDAGVLSIDSPSTFCSGAQNIVATIKNYGRNQLTSVNINWSLDGVPQTPIAYSGVIDTTGGPNNTRSFVLGSYTFPVSPLTAIKVWTSMPNNVVDTTRQNDTIQVFKAPSISGAKTINPAGSGPNNYTSFTSAVNALVATGVCGPVYFTVAPGVYNEKVTIPPVPGASATNTITFDGVDSSTRILTYTASTTSGHGTFELAGADYITVRNLRIVAAGATYGIGVHINGNADYNTIENCVINVTGTTSTYSVGVGICGATMSTSGANGNFNLIRNNRITGGYASISCMGVSTTTFVQGNKFHNNQMLGAYLYGGYCYYNNLLEFNDNRVFPTYGTTNTYGLMNYYSNNFRIQRNMIRSQYMGLYLYYDNYTNNPGFGWCTDNMLWGFNYSTTYPVYHYYTSNTNFYNNTVYQQSNTANTAYGVYFVYGSNNNVKNNIFYNRNNTGSAAYSIYAIDNTTFASMDYNIFYSAHPSNFVYMGAARANLAALKTAYPSLNQNSLQTTVDFVNTTVGSEDLHIMSSVPAAFGEGNLGNTTDVDGEPRCTFAPTIGADESKFITPPPVAGYSVGTIYINSPTTFYNNNGSGLPFAHWWYVNGTLVSTSTNLTQTFSTLGSQTISLKTQGCNGIDSISTTVTVVNPSNTPVSNFISNKNIIPVYNSVKFTDLSSDGPTQWSWTVTPGVLGSDFSYTNGTSATSQNPEIFFSTPGNYTICLMADNGLGSGTNNCKSAYIVVQPSNSMCIYPFNSNIASGLLYDSGGPSASYTQNENCLFTIDACADSTYITFSELNMGTGTADRIMIYNNATGTGTPVATFTGGTAYPLPLTVKTGRFMTIREQTDGTSNNGTGFAAVWSIKPGSYGSASGEIVGPDSAFYCSTPPVVSTYSCSFVDANSLYTWDFENDGIDDAIGLGLTTAQYAFAGTGTVVNKLTVSGCAGTFVDYDTITVVNALTPIANFSTNLTAATASDTIQLTDLSNYGPTSWTWTITGPGTPLYVNSTANSRNPKMVLPVAGSYTVKLEVCNCAGCDDTTFTSYINVIGYCTPTVGTLNPDLGIANFQLGIINYTPTTPAPGLVDYRNLTQLVPPAYLDRGAAYSLKLTRVGVYNAANKKVWADWNKDGTFDPINELVASDPSNNNQIWNGTFTVPVTASLGVTRLRVATSYGSMSNAPCGPNAYGEFQDYRIVVQPDITKPVITLKGLPTYSIEIGRTYVDSCATALDGVDGNISDSIFITGWISGRSRTYNPPAPRVADALGTFDIYYDVKDASGNVADQVEREITVTPDVTKPVITITGANPQYVEVNTAYNDSGATATDFYFGPITPVNASSTVNDAIVGTYTVTYTATDASGNDADPEIRTVIVRDTQKPVIVFPPSTDTIYMEVNTGYVDPGATVSDNYYSGIVPTMSGAVNPFALGTYELTFNATDGSGNVATPRKRWVIVQDKTAPVFNLIGADTMLIEVNTLTVVPEPGWIVTDNYYPQNQITVAKSGSVNLNSLGFYTVTYTAIDGSGNQAAAVTRVYHVVDRTKPVITLNGADVINICRWQTFVDPGVTVSDNYYSALLPVVGGSVDVNIPGLYYITYNAMDGSGNAATPVIRYIRVTECTTGLGESDLLNAINVYPNPSAGNLNISINLANAQNVKVSIYNSLGELVQVVADVNISSGQYQVDLSKMAGGVYFVHFETEGQSTSKKITLIK